MPLPESPQINDEENISEDNISIDPLQDELDNLKKTCEELDHKYKLALADYQNLLRQTSKERKDSILYANEALILDLLPVYDNLKLSIKHANPDNKEPWLVGLTHVIQQFKKVLEEAGVKEVTAEGETFNPISMEAVETRETNAKKDEGKVAEELKSGYYLNDKVIIPARVAVYSCKT
jgi:molecular chaperone GrpE